LVCRNILGGGNYFDGTRYEVLIGKNWDEYIKEAKRCLVTNGILIITETTKSMKGRLSKLRDIIRGEGFEIYTDAMVGKVIVTSESKTSAEEGTTSIPSEEPSSSPIPASTSEPSTSHHIHAKSKGGHVERGPVGGYDTGFAVGAERANEAVDQFDNGQSKGIDADKSPRCPAVDEGNGYCRGFHDGWRKTVLDRLD
jgi:hypothetical protein